MYPKCSASEMCTLSVDLSIFWFLNWPRRKRTMPKLCSFASRDHDPLYLAKLWIDVNGWRVARGADGETARSGYRHSHRHLPEAHKSDATE